MIWIRRDPETSAGLFASLVSDCVAARYSGRLRSCGSGGIQKHPRVSLLQQVKYIVPGGDKKVMKYIST